VRLLALALAAAAVIAGCEPVPPPTELDLRMTFANDEAELRRYCGDDLVIEPLGCARGGVMTTPPSKECRVYLFEPRGFDDRRRLETLGEEVWHCVKGRKHI
jgi:hypothetical protein